MSVKYTKKVAEFICEKVAEGLTVAQVARKYPNDVPNDMTIYQWSQRKPEFREMLNEAYEIWLYRKLEELEELSSKPASHYYPELEFKEAEAALKRRIDTLKFALGKMGPVLNKRFTPKAQVEHNIESNVPILQILNYAATEPATKKIETKPAIDGEICE